MSDTRNMSHDQTPSAAPPRAELVPARQWWSLSWLAPLAAILLVVGLLYQSSEQRGALVRVEFTDAAGLRTGDPVLHRGIEVGQVRDVRLAGDLRTVTVTLELRPDAEGLAREGARFWIVRPEVSLQRVSGLETLLGPRYVEVLRGDADAPIARRFQGLEQAPPIGAITPGALEVIVRAPRRGSIVVGSPVLYRDVVVGVVRSMELAPDARAVEVLVVIEPRYATLVRDNSRFWNAGGIGVDWGLLAGLTVRAESLENLLTGAIGFATPRRPGEEVAQFHEFDLEPEPKSDWLDWAPEIPLADATDSD